VIVRRLRSSLPLGGTIFLSLALVFVAVICPPNQTDIWLYQMYGRTAVHYHENPYRHAPVEFQPDPVLARSDGFWTGLRPLYGPALVGLATAVYAATGPGELAGRLAWQGLVGLAVLATIALVAWRTRNAAAVAMIGLNAVIIYSVVNGGHADALIGLAVLGAVLLAERNRYIASALAMTLAVLLKLPLMIALLALLVWMAYKNFGRAVAAAAASGVVGLVAVGAYGGPGVVITPLLDARTQVSAMTPWNLVRQNGLTSFTGHTATLGPLGDALPLLSLGMGVVVTAILIVAWRGDVDPAPSVSTVITAWLAVALYGSPWSFAWVLPVLALKAFEPPVSTRLAVVWVGATLMVSHWGSVTTASAWLGSPSFSSYDVAYALLIDLTIGAAISVLLALIGEALSNRPSPWRGAAPQPTSVDVRTELLNARTVDIS